MTGGMRELFEDIVRDEAKDPIAAARRSLRGPPRKRSYSQVEVGSALDIRLDGRPVRTPGRRVLAAPTPALAQAIANEWLAQSTVIDPTTMPLTRLANTIIDCVMSAPREVTAEITRYLGSDLLFYRAETPEGLVERQTRLWNPILAWARDTLDANFVLGVGVTFIQQPQAALAAATGAIPSDLWRLAAVNLITTLTGSALIALALASEALSLDAAWAAANVDEDWNLGQWGRDAAALERRAVHFRDMQAAAQVLKLTA